MPSAHPQARDEPSPQQTRRHWRGHLDESSVRPSSPDHLERAGNGIYWLGDPMVLVGCLEKCHIKLGIEGDKARRANEVAELRYYLRQGFSFVVEHHLSDSREVGDFFRDRLP